MKNGNLYKVAFLSLALVMLSVIGFAQNDQNQKVIKKKKTIMITKTTDEDGESTIDTLVFETPELNMDEIMEKLEVSKEKMKEIHMQIEAEMNDVSKSVRFEIEDRSDEIEKAMEDLKNELKNLDVEAEAQQRINDAMKRLEEVGKYGRTHMERFIIDKDHPVFVGEEGQIEVLVDDGKNVQKKVFWVDKNGEVEEEISKEIKVWVDSNGENKVIVHSDGDDEDENVYVFKTVNEIGDEEVVDLDISDAKMDVISAVKQRDLDRAIAAGLPIEKEKGFENLEISVDLKKDQDPLIKIRTNADGKLKATVYDKDFEKVKKLKVNKENGSYILHLDIDDLNDSKAQYILLEQDGKTDLMRVYK